MLSKKVTFENPVLSFDLYNNNIYAISGKNLFRLDMLTGQVLSKRELFPKDGLSRSLVCDNKYVYCKDFCTFYILDADSLNTIYQGMLGEDLSSDICGLAFDEKNIYASIRGGYLAIVDKRNYFIEKKPITNSTFIMKLDNDSLYFSAEGKLLVIDKKTFQQKDCVEGHKVCEGFILDEQIIITAGKDKIIKRNKVTLEMIQQIRKPHKFSFYIIDFWKEYFITFAFRDGVIRIWDTQTMTSVKDINVQSCLTGNAKIHGDTIYISSRGITGIEYAELNSLLMA